MKIKTLCSIIVCASAFAMGEEQNHVANTRSYLDPNLLYHHDFIKNFMQSMPLSQLITSLDRETESRNANEILQRLNSLKALIQQTKAIMPELKRKVQLFSLNSDTGFERSYTISWNEIDKKTANNCLPNLEAQERELEQTEKDLEELLDSYEKNNYDAFSNKLLCFLKSFLPSKLFISENFDIADVLDNWVKEGAANVFEENFYGKNFAERLFLWKNWIQLINRKLHEFHHDSQFMNTRRKILNEFIAKISKIEFNAKKISDLAEQINFNNASLHAIYTKLYYGNGDIRSIFLASQNFLRQTSRCMKYMQFPRDLGIEIVDEDKVYHLRITSLHMNKILRADFSNFPHAFESLRIVYSLPEVYPMLNWPVQQ